MPSLFSRRHDTDSIPLHPLGHHDPTKPAAAPPSRGPGYAFFSWKWEITAWLCGLGLFASMVAVLARQDGRPVDDWNFPVNVNSLMALLSTVYRAIMCAIAAEVISQSKWIWFWSTSKPVPLLQFQYFDSGSRGIWGAGRLMPTAIRRSPTALAAALVLVVSFATGPFIQQAIGTINREYVLSDGDASLSVSRSLDANGTFYRTLSDVVYGQWDFKYTTRAALLTAMANPNSNDTAINPTCTSGNCTFPSWETGNRSSPDEVTHATVGLCNQCFDVTSLIINTTNTSSNSTGAMSYKLPTGVNITLFDRTTWLSIHTYDNLTWAQSVISDEQSAILRWAMANVTILTVGKQNKTDLEPSIPVAVTCSIYSCLRSYSASVTNGHLSEKLLHTTPMYPDLGNYTSSDLTGYRSPYNQGGFTGADGEIPLSAVQDPCMLNGTVYTGSELANAPNATDVRILSPSNAPDYPSTKAPQGCMYRMTGFYDMMLLGFLGDHMLSGDCSWDPRQGDSIRCDEKYWLAQFWGLGQATAQTINSTFDSFTEAVTRQFRLGLGRESGTESAVSGESLRTGTFTLIQWKWFAFPILLLLIETVVLCWMIARSIWRRGDEMVWKSNTLPLLYYGQDRFVDAHGVPLRDYAQQINADSGAGGANGTTGELMSTEEMEKDARKVYVTLTKGGRSTGVSSGEGASYISDGSSYATRRRRDWDQDSLLQG